MFLYLFATQHLAAEMPRRQRRSAIRQFQDFLFDSSFLTANNILVLLFSLARSLS